MSTFAVGCFDEYDDLIILLVGTQFPKHDNKVKKRSLIQDGFSCGVLGTFHIIVYLISHACGLMVLQSSLQLLTKFIELPLTTSSKFHCWVFVASVVLRYPSGVSRANILAGNIHQMRLGAMSIG